MVCLHALANLVEANTRNPMPPLKKQDNNGWVSELREIVTTRAHRPEGGYGDVSDIEMMRKDCGVKSSHYTYPQPSPSNTQPLHVNADHNSSSLANADMHSIHLTVLL